MKIEEIDRIFKEKCPSSRIESNSCMYGGYCLACWQPSRSKKTCIICINSKDKKRGEVHCSNKELLSLKKILDAFTIIPK